MEQDKGGKAEENAASGRRISDLDGWQLEKVKYWWDSFEIMWSHLFPESPLMVWKATSIRVANTQSCGLKHKKSINN